MTILVLSICLFLRFDEIDGMRMEHFKPEHFMFDSAGYTKAICVEVCGKSDKKWVSMMIWTDDECPEFCPVRLLLSYVHCSGIKGGVLFPVEADLRNPPNDGIFQTPLTYKVMRLRMVNLVRTLLKLPATHFKTGLHVTRRTAYLFAIFGSGQIASIAPSARHKNIDTAMHYAHDAETLFAKQRIFRNPRNRVKKWIPTVLLSAGNAMLLNIDSMDFECDLVELSTRFVVDHLKIAPNHPAYTSPTFVTFKSLAMVRPANSADEMATLMAPLPPGDQTKLTHLIQLQVQQQVSFHLSQYQDSIATHPPPPMETGAPLEHQGASTTPPPLPANTATEDNIMPLPPPKKKARTEGHFTYPHIAKIKVTKLPREKLEYLVGMKAMNVPTSDRTRSSGTFYDKYVTPVTKCFELHCNSNPDVFVARYPNFLHSTYKCNCV